MNTFHRHSRKGWVALLAALTLGLALAGCEGDDGKDGLDGSTGPAGTAGTPSAPGINRIGFASSGCPGPKSWPPNVGASIAAPDWVVPCITTTGSPVGAPTVR